MKKLLSIALFGLMIIGLGTTTFAGPGEVGDVAGTVVDGETGEAVAEATVFIRICVEPDGGLQGAHMYSTTTDANGEFFISGVPVGEWDAIARLRGFGRDEEVILVDIGATTVVNFELEGNGCPGGLQMRLHQGGN